MKNVRLSALALLILNGIAAITGGVFLLADPSGAALRAPLHWLEGTPFANFFIPGLVLTVLIGALSISAAAAVALKNRYASVLTILEGALLGGWIIVQIVTIREFSILQVVFGGLGFAIFGLGMIMADDEFALNKYD